jgi:hypothetical protein
MPLSPEILTMSGEELVASVWTMTPQNPQAVSVDRLLRLRKMESEQAGTEALVAATKALVATTDKLVTATERLGSVTWWLMLGTALLGATAAADFVLKLIRGAH